jgi:type I restriction enzyme S subunit
MSENWKTYKLSAVFEIIGGGTPKTSVIEYWNGNIPWLSVVDFNNDQRTVLTTEKTISELGLRNSSTKLLKKGQLIISARGTVGQIAQLGKDMAFNQSCYGLNGKHDLLINDFGYYLLKHSVSNIKSNAYGSVFDTITTNTFDNILVKIPLLPEQRSIASILSAIDDKIELNLQMNKTLEEMAMTLYKHWFVDFGPFKDGEFVDSELGRIPKGWEVKSLNELGKMFYGQMPKKELITEDGYPIYSGYRKVGFYQNYNCEKGKVIVVARGVGGTGDVKLTADQCFLTNLSICIANNLEILDDSLLFFGLKRNGLDHLRTGSAQPQITINDLNSVAILAPNKDIQFQFLNIFSPLLQEMESNIIENQTLTTLRDTLLPKLISGEVRVKEAEKILEETL